MSTVSAQRLTTILMAWIVCSSPTFGIVTAVSALQDPASASDGVGGSRSGSAPYVARSAADNSGGGGGGGGSGRRQYGSTIAIPTRLPVMHPASSTTELAGTVQLDVPMSNMTRYEGESIRILCEITGQPLPRYSWYKDGRLIDASGTDLMPIYSLAGGGRDEAPSSSSSSSSLSPSSVDITLSSRFNVKTMFWGSRLKIDNLRVSDSGTYRCDGYNKFGQQSTNGILTVISGPNPNRDRKQSNSEVEESDVIDREDLDFGSPMFSGLPRKHNQQRHQLQPQQRPQQSAAGSVYGNDPTGELGISSIRENIELYDHVSLTGSGRSGGAGQCQKYSGSTCSKFLAGRCVFIPVSTDQTRLENRVTGALSELATFNGQMSPQCLQHALPVLCYQAFQPCSLSSGGTVLSGTGNNRDNIDGRCPTKIQHGGGRRICRDVCDRIERTVCHEEYVFVRRTTMIIDNLLSLLPDCTRLSNDRAECIPLDNVMQADNFAMINYDHDCFNGTGTDYRGTVATSQTGEKCLNWNSFVVVQQQQPQPQLGSHNYCRNPGNVHLEPWCYTSAAAGSGLHAVREPCAVPRCNVDTTSGSDDIIRYAVISCAAFIVVIGLISFVVCIRRRRPCCRQSIDITVSDRLAGHHGTALGVPDSLRASGRPSRVIDGYCCKLDHSNRSTTPSSGWSKQTIQHISASQIRLLRCLDNSCDYMTSSVQGSHFGPIYIGEFTSWPTSVTVNSGRVPRTKEPNAPVIRQLVLVRALRPDADKRMRAEFWSETEKCASVGHRNLMAIIGVTGQNGDGLGGGSSADDSRQLYLADGLKPTNIITSTLFELDESSVDLHRFLVSFQIGSRDDPTGVEFHHGDYFNDPMTALIWKRSIASQIATAVDYLHCRGISHGDLAARNCFVILGGVRSVASAPTLPHPVVKVSFGLAVVGRSMYPADYPPIGLRGLPLPLRWVPPETVCAAINNTTSPNFPFSNPAADVWSFGVTLWELCTVGNRPYGGLSDQEVVDLVASGRILPQLPASSLPQAYDADRRLAALHRMYYLLMAECWRIEPCSRPTLRQIVERLESINHHIDFQMAAEQSANVLTEVKPTPPSVASSSQTSNHSKSAGRRVTATTADSGHSSCNGAVVDVDERMNHNCVKSTIYAPGLPRHAAAIQL